MTDNETGIARLLERKQVSSGLSQRYAVFALKPALTQLWQLLPRAEKDLIMKSTAGEMVTIEVYGETITIKIEDASTDEVVSQSRECSTITDLQNRRNL